MSTVVAGARKVRTGVAGVFAQDRDLGVAERVDGGDDQCPVNEREGRDPQPPGKALVDERDGGRGRSPGRSGR